MGVTVGNSFNCGKVIMPFDKSAFIAPLSFVDGTSSLKKANLLKNDFLREYAAEVSAKEFYRDVFSHDFEPEGIDTSKTTGRGNMMCVSMRPDGTFHTDIITEELRDNLDKIYKNNKCALIPLVTFYGRTAKAVNARYIFGIAIDLDYVSLENLSNIFFQFQHHIIPVPTYIVNSGTGVHLYYLWHEPLPAYPMTRKAVTEFKRALTRVVWNSHTSTQEPTTWDKKTQSYRDRRQYQGAVQGYRVVGSLSKLGAGYPVSVFKCGDKYDVEDLNKWLLDDDKDCAITDDKCRYKSELSLAEAKEKYPDWYERKIIKKELPKKWNKSTKLYEWFLKRLKSDCRFGHRYHCICMLTVYAVKCNVPKEKVLEDSLGLYDHLNSLNSSNPITKEEIEKAVNGFYKEESNTLPVSSISYLSGIDIQKSKRNGRTQEKHLERARALQKVDYPDGEWRNKDGAPIKEHLIKEWKQAHPDGNKSQCAKDLGLSRTTVIKWW